MQQTQETLVPSLGQEDPLEEGTATYSSVLAWGIPWTEEPGRLQSIGSQRVRHYRSDWACTHAPSPFRAALSCPMHPVRVFHRLFFSESPWDRLLLFSCSVMSDSMDCSMPGFPVLHHLLEFAQTHVHWISDTIQPSHPLSFPSSPAFNLSQHWGLFQWVSSSGNQSIGVSASALVIPMNIQGWFPLGLTGLICS